MIVPAALQTSEDGVLQLADTRSKKAGEYEAWVLGKCCLLTGQVVRRWRCGGVVLDMVAGVAVSHRRFLDFLQCPATMFLDSVISAVLVAFTS